MAQPFNFSLNEKSVEVSLIKCNPVLEILSNGFTFKVSSVAQVSSHCFTLIVDGKRKPSGGREMMTRYISDSMVELTHCRIRTL